MICCQRQLKAGAGISTADSLKYVDREGGRNEYFLHLPLRKNNLIIFLFVFISKGVRLIARVHLDDIVIAFMLDHLLTRMDMIMMVMTFVVM